VLRRYTCARSDIPFQQRVKHRCDLQATLLDAIRLDAVSHDETSWLLDLGFWLVAGTGQSVKHA
jgi:hypothetical protein